MSRKKGGHHGGAWKVAYADFVTAMMALFLVLWLTSQDTKIKEAIERSFSNPFASLTKESTGIIESKEKTTAIKSKEGNFDSAAAVELNFLRKIQEEIIKSLQSPTDNQDDEAIKLELTPEGLRISVFDRAKRPVFEADTPRFTAYGDWVFSTLAWQVSYYTNVFRIELEGHTQQGYPLNKPGYGVWNLSCDRALAAQGKMVQHGMLEAQVRKVSGFADTMPLTDCLPTDERNRRVTLLLKLKTKGQIE